MKKSWVTVMKEKMLIIDIIITSELIINNAGLNHKLLNVNYINIIINWDEIVRKDLSFKTIDLL